MSMTTCMLVCSHDQHCPHLPPRQPARRAAGSAPRTRWPRAGTCRCASSRGAAGVSHAAPRRHFADKQALLDALAEDGFQRLGRAAARAPRPARTSPRRLLGFARAYVALRGRARGAAGADVRRQAPLGGRAGGVRARVRGAAVDDRRRARRRARSCPATLEEVATVAVATLHGLAAMVNNGMLEAAALDEIVPAAVERLVLGLRPRTSALEELEEALQRSEHHGPHDDRAVRVPGGDELDPGHRPRLTGRPQGDINPGGYGSACKWHGSPCSVSFAALLAGCVQRRRRRSAPPARACRRAPSCRSASAPTKYPHIRRHYERAVARGLPDRARRAPVGDGRAPRSSAAVAAPTRAGMDRDEYPPAVGRASVRASVAYVPSSENRSHGATLGHQAAPLLRRHALPLRLLLKTATKHARTASSPGAPDTVACDA